LGLATSGASDFNRTLERKLFRLTVVSLAMVV